MLRPLLLSLLLTAACGGLDDLPVARVLDLPPVVSLAVPASVPAGAVLRVTVTVAGCDEVRGVTLYDRDSPLKTFPYAAGDVALALEPKDLPVASALELTAEAECASGQVGRSPPQLVYFSPATLE